MITISSTLDLEYIASTASAELADRIKANLSSTDWCERRFVKVRLEQRNTSVIFDVHSQFKLLRLSSEMEWNDIVEVYCFYKSSKSFNYEHYGAGTMKYLLNFIDMEVKPIEEIKEVSEKVETLDEEKKNKPSSR